MSASIQQFDYYHFPTLSDHAVVQGVTKKNKGLAVISCEPFIVWLRGPDLNRRPSGYEPDELPLLHPALRRPNYREGFFHVNIYSPAFFYRTLYACSGSGILTGGPVFLRPPLPVCNALHGSDNNRGLVSSLKNREAKHQ